MAETTAICPDCGNHYYTDRPHICTILPVSVPLASKDGVAEITKARGSVYGPFLHNAIVGQAIRSALRNLPNPDNDRHWEDLPLDVREGLDYIAGKMSRIVTGDPEYLDNWDDIGGFAKIVADRIRRNQQQEKTDA